MESDEISWQIVPNTVANRMRDFSLIHKLIPLRRLRRRTKAMNTAFKHFHSLKSYSQYVKMKTSILRDISDESDTDDSASFTEDDYNILYKSNASLSNYTTQISANNTNYSSETEFNFSENDIASDTVTGKKRIQKSKNRFVNLGWQEVVKKKNGNVSFPSDRATRNKFTYTNSASSQRNNVKRDTQDGLNLSDNHISFVNNFENDNLCQKNKVSRNDEPSTAGKFVELHAETTNLNEVADSIATVQEVKSDSNKLMGETNFMTNETNEGFQSEESLCFKMVGSDGAVESIKNNLKPLLDDSNIIQNVNKPIISTQVCLGQIYSGWTDQNQKIQETSVDENKGSKFLQIQSVLIGNANQPKDSGIEEDTEEEFPEDEKRIYNKARKETRETCQTMPIIPSVLNHRNNSVVENSLTTSNDNLVSDGHGTWDRMDSQGTAQFAIENVDNTEEQQDRVERQRLQPKVTCTEIVSKKYRIISSDTLLPNNCIELESSIERYCNEEVLETVEAEQNMEDSMSALSKRRLQQLRRLNLTVDSESSLSEDDDTYCQTENMRDKLLKRSNESSDSSSSEDENVGFLSIASVQFGKKLERTKNSKFEERKEETNVCPITIYKEYTKNRKTSNNDGSEQSLKFAESNDKIDLHAITNQDQSISGNSSEGIICCSDNEGNRSERYTKIKERSFQNSPKINKNLEIGTTVEARNKNTAVRRRPCNLQEFIEEENLIYETAVPSFKFKDIREDDIFLLDIPSMVLESQLLGKKIVLTEKKLKLGKRKYKVAFKDIDHVSCVFSTGKSHKPYKTVNIKPVTRVVARQKIVKTQIATSPNQHMSGSASCTKNIDEIETNVVRTKRNPKKKYNLSFKKKL